MTRMLAVAIAGVALASCGDGGGTVKGIFPAGFMWGSASAAFQVESAEQPATDWSVWDSMPGRIANDDHASAGPDAWNHFDEDVTLAKQMGHNAFRLSIEWARIEPTPGTFDELAIARYKAMIASLKQHGLRPIVTLWHFTSPTWAHDPSGATPSSLGGWSKPAVADAFVSYVERVVPRFSDDVDFWITLNEPMVYIINGHFFGTWPPGKTLDFPGATATHNNLISAHVRAYDAIHAHYASKGKPVTVTIASHFVAFDPATPDAAEATKGVERLVDYAFLDAIVKGDVDAQLDGTIVHRDDYMNHADVIGVNYYQRQIVTNSRIGIVPGTPGVDPAATLKNDLGWEMYPAGMGRALDGLWGRYHLPLVVTESGLADAADRWRAWYIVSHVDEVQSALARGVDVRGYLYWSLIDNFEWAEGFAARFGLIGIDYASPTRARKVRPSAAALTAIIRANGVSDEIRARFPLVK